ncbi:hypothetical protein AGLY_013713 [Aphis glycines]|uniref:Reverse transcriptase domain-containing protein n=1 Tax=Aphis glycines TaxID=307491 RepID=A0A6G0T991_APHGL|nr:hypothetical protein AGLY_013713 [Aphis glycines]
MLLTLRKRGVEQQNLRIIHSLYKNQTACIKKGEITTNALINKGVEQGCTLSPPLFNYYIEKVINIVKERVTRLNVGIKIGGEIVSIIRFADDIVVIAESEGDLQRAVEEMDEMLRTSEMKINSIKTKILVYDRDPKVKADLANKGYDIEGKKIARRPKNSYIGQIKCDVKVKTFKELKEKASIKLEWRIGVVNQPSG